jgi:hypothetical protein
MLFISMQELKDKYILIISNEQPPETKAIVPKDKSNYQEVVSYYVGSTFSSICSCTLLKASDNHSWDFMFFSDT